MGQPGWGGDGWTDPREAAAAAEMARHAEAERQVEDARTESLSDAIRWGFAELAFAVKQVGIAVISAADSNSVTERFMGSGARHPIRGPERVASPAPSQDDAAIRFFSDCAMGIYPDGFNEDSAQADSDIDDLIDEQ